MSTMNFEIMNKRKLSNFEEYSQMLPSEVVITRESLVSNLYRVYIDNKIDDSVTYRSLITLLGSATEEDTVIFHLCCPGGDADIAMQIYLAILNTRANTVAQIDGYAASAATFFVMACDRVLVGPHAFMMLHSGSFGNFGKQRELKTYTDFQYKRLEKIAYDVYEDFLSSEEIKDMVDNQCDYYFDAEEIIKRLERRDDIKVQKMQESVVEEELPVEVEEVPVKQKKKRSSKND